MSQGTGTGQTETFPTEAQPHPSTNPLQFSILQKDPQSQTEGKTICQHFHGRNVILGTLCTSGTGRFYCFGGCLGTVNIPPTQIPHFGAPSTFLGAQSFPREKEEQQTGEIWKDEIKLSQSGTLLIPALDAFWMSCCFMDGLGCAGALECEDGAAPGWI